MSRCAFFTFINLFVEIAAENGNFNEQINFDKQIALPYDTVFNFRLGAEMNEIPVQRIGLEFSINAVVLTVD